MYLFKCVHNENRRLIIDREVRVANNLQYQLAAPLFRVNLYFRLPVRSMNPTRSFVRILWTIEASLVHAIAIVSLVHSQKLQEDA